MERGSQKLHAILAEVEAPQGLYAAILERVAHAKRRAAQWRTGVFALVALFSGAALVPVFQYTAEQFYSSGFYEYLSLALSDHALVLTYWREFALSLLESLPSLALLMLLPLLAALVWSLMRLVKNARTVIRYA